MQYHRVYFVKIPMETGKLVLIENTETGQQYELPGRTGSQHFAIMLVPVFDCLREKDGQRIIQVFEEESLEDAHVYVVLTEPLVQVKPGQRGAYDLGDRPADRRQQARHPKHKRAPY